MAENIPPSTTAATSSTTPATNGITTNTSNHGGIMTANGIVGGSDSNNRGLPYYEKLRRELRDLLTRKPVHDKNLVRQKSKLLDLKPEPGLSFPLLVHHRILNLHLRNLLPRRNHCRQHNPRFRQLHQRRLGLLHLRKRRSQPPPRPGQRIRSHLQQIERRFRSAER